VAGLHKLKGRVWAARGDRARYAAKSWAPTATLRRGWSPRSLPRPSHRRPRWAEDRGLPYC